eukprot:6961057-Alexandrium_andersonii.AAC.1
MRQGDSSLEGVRGLQDCRCQREVARGPHLHADLDGPPQDRRGAQPGVRARAEAAGPEQAGH